MPFRSIPIERTGARCQAPFAGNTGNRRQAPVALGASLSLAMIFAAGCAGRPPASGLQRPPRVDPLAFRVHTVCVDMPVARLRELMPALGSAAPLMRAAIDETDTRARLLDLARADPSLAVTTRDDVVLQPGASARVPAGRSRAASDALDIDVKVAPSAGWEAFTLGFTIVRRDSSSEKHVADAQMPGGYRLEVDIVSAAENLRGIVVFLEPEIVWPETGDL